VPHPPDVPFFEGQLAKGVQFRLGFDSNLGDSGEISTIKTYTEPSFDGFVVSLPGKSPVICSWPYFGVEPVG
jgi:hypothetical protein